MPGPPIRKPSDHSPPAGSPRNIAGHHVLHRPLMPRHPPNAHKNKQHNTRQNTCRRLTVRCSRPLYSSQPTHPHPQQTPNAPPTTPGRGHTTQRPTRAGQPGRTAPEPRQHATPNKRGTHQPPPPHKNRKQKQDRRAFYTNTRQPATPHNRAGQPATASAGAAPAGPDPTTRPRQDQTTRKPPPHNLSLERR